MRRSLIPADRRGKCSRLTGSTGFVPGVRFFFRCDRLITRPGAVFEGVLPPKVKDEVVLKDRVQSIIIPEADRAFLEPAVPAELADRVIFVKNDCRDIWEWSEKVYETAKSMKE